MLRFLVPQMYGATRSDGLGAEVKRRILMGTYALSAGYYDAYYKRAQQVRTLVQREMESSLGTFDALLMPSAPTVAYKSGEKTADPLAMYKGDVMTVNVNLAGLPAISGESESPLAMPGTRAPAGGAWLWLAHGPSWPTPSLLQCRADSWTAPGSPSPCPWGSKSWGARSGRRPLWASRMLTRRQPPSPTIAYFAEAVARARFQQIPGTPCPIPCHRRRMRLCDHDVVGHVGVDLIVGHEARPRVLRRRGPERRRRATEIAGQHRPHLGLQPGVTMG